MSLFQAAKSVAYDFSHILEVRTQKKRAFWSWACYLGIMAGGISFANGNNGAPLTFLIKQFVDDPFLIVLITGANQILSVIVAPYASWKTDRFWTRWGRRKPFMIVGWSMMAMGLALLPFAPNIWALLAAYLLWMVSFDFGYMGVWTPLCYEVVPSPQRGRAQVIRRFIGIPMSLFYSYVLIAQLKSNYPFSFGGFHYTFTGYHLAFGSGALAMVVILMMLLFGLKEVHPEKAVPRERFAIWSFLHSLFGERQWRIIYLLIFCITCMTAGLASLGPLLIRDQFHYSMKDLAIMQTVALALEVAIILPLSASIVDRFNRFRIFQVGLFLSTVHPLAYWLFVQFGAGNHIPTITWIIIFTMFNSVVDQTASIAMEPLVYDMIPRSHMGTVNSGFLLVRHLLGFFVTGGVGLWVKGHAWMSGAPKVLGEQGKLAPNYDYMIGFLYVFALGVAGCGVAWYFGHELKAGRIIQYGKLEDEGKLTSAAIAQELAAGGPQAPKPPSKE